MKKGLFTVLFISLAAFTAFSQSSHGGNLGNDGSIVTIVEGRLGAILGGVKNGKVIPIKEAEQSLVAATSFKLYGIVEGVNEGELTIKTEMGDGDICPDFYGVNFSEKVAGGLAFTDNVSWNPMPRKVTKIDNDSRVYKKIVRDFLRKNGIRTSKPKIREAYRVDLDGNGTDEVVIRATNYSKFGPGAKKNEYSFVMVRRLVGKKVEEVLITGDFIKKDLQFGAPNRHQISGIADLNGDGNMEVVVFGEYYEGQWVEAYSLKDNAKQLVMQTGCGV